MIARRWRSTASRSPWPSGSATAPTVGSGSWGPEPGTTMPGTDDTGPTATPAPGTPRAPAHREPLRPIRTLANALSLYRWLDGPGWPTDRGRRDRWRTALWLARS